MLGGGCFWCLEAVFQKIKGVRKVESGYAGGNCPDPTYEQVCADETGHAETVLVEYDEAEVSLEKILDIFFFVHNPTTPNRQGNDVGSQYRSIILWTNPGQETIIKNYIKKIKREFQEPVITEVKKLDKFYPAEAYHMDFYNRNKSMPYCQFVVVPKVKKVEKDFPDFIK